MRIWGLVVAFACSGCGRFGFYGGASDANGDDEPSDDGGSDGSTPGSALFTVATQWRSAFALRADGALFGWGYNADGELGLGNEDLFYTTPQRVPGMWSRVWAGSGRACAEDLASSDIYCWGSFQGPVYSSPTFSRPGPIIDMSIGVYDITVVVPSGTEQWSSTQPPPMDVTSDVFASATQVSAFESHSCIIDTVGVYCEGLNASGQLGNGTKVTTNGPYELVASGTWLSISAGAVYTCAVRDDHTLWCWGTNSDGTFGQPAPAESLTPTQMGTRTDWTRVIAGGYHVCAERTDGTMWCAGARMTDTFTQISGTAWRSFDAGSDFSCGVRADEVWCWGVNSSGQLGQGNQTAIADFVRVEFP
jgi:alpha-tubulin suppressor-like RCC1 family protein